MGEHQNNQNVLEKLIVVEMSEILVYLFRFSLFVFANDLLIVVEKVKYRDQNSGAKILQVGFYLFFLVKFDKEEFRTDKSCNEGKGIEELQKDHQRHHELYESQHIQDIGDDILDPRSRVVLRKDTPWQKEKKKIGYDKKKNDVETIKQKDLV